jgi:dual specificity MAP kinase phosphatase
MAAAHEQLYRERASICPCPTRYNVFVLCAHPSQLPQHILTPVPSFAQLEMQEMQDLTQATEILPGIFLGNSGDVPVWSSHEAGVNVFDNSNNPSGYDLVVECADGNSSVPSPTHLKRAEDHLQTLQSLWATGFMSTPPARPAPNAHSILHLPFPCSPSQQTPNNHIVGFIQFIQNLLHPQHSSRRAKVLIYGHDGYTETSVLALILIMAEKKCALPEAYLELQIGKKRSFFVHQGDLGILRKLEVKYSGLNHGSLGRAMGRSKERNDKDRSGWHWNGFGKHNQPNEVASSPPSSSALGIKFGKKTSISPLPSSFDNATWFNHPRFDGSFPSRVLPFLYLGNL